MTPASPESASFIDRSTPDKQERQAIIQSIRDAIDSGIATAAGDGFVLTATFPPTATFDLQSLFIPRVINSSFDDAYDPAREALQKMTETEAFALLRKRYSYSTGIPVGVDDKGNLFTLFDSYRFPIPIDSDDSGVLAEEMAMLTEFASQTGGYVYTGETVSVEQWLAFEGLSPPCTIGEARNLIAYLEFELPDAPALGDFQELLSAGIDSPFHLSAPDREIIRQAIEEITEGKISLLQKLSYDNFTLISDADKRASADQLIESLLKKEVANTLGKTLHERLGWHLSDAAKVSERQLREFLVAALIIDRLAQPHQPPLAGYEVYQPGNATRNAAQVREDFEQHLITKGLSEPNNAPLLAHMLLAGAAPELLVPDIPADLTLGKPGWVAIAQAVAMIEHTSPGVSRSMTFAQIRAFSELAPVSPEQSELHEATGIIPVINWAVLNHIIAYRADRTYSKAIVLKAATYFNEYMVALHQSESGLSTPPPDREKIALQALRKVLPDGRYIEQKSFQILYRDSFKERSWLEALKVAHPLGILSEFYDFLMSSTDNNDYALNSLLRMRLSVLDLYLSGDLIENGELTDKFKTKSDFNPPENAFARLSELPSAAVLFDQAFAEYYKGMQESLSSIIKMAISNMPEADRYALTNGNMTLYTVRKEVNWLNPKEETQLDRDEAIGRYGIILCCTNGNDVRAYELFSLRGLCIARPELASMLKRTGILHARPTLSFVGSKYDFQPKNKEKHWPIDYAAYKEGSEPRSGITSSVVVEKLWHLSLYADEVRPISLFFSPELAKLVDFLLVNHAVASRKELYASLDIPTRLEEWRTTKELFESAAINVIVPFKQCIEDIRSGQNDRVSQGIGGCVLDGLSIIGLLIGLGASVASIIAKTGSTTLKVLKVAQAVARAALSLANPLDGLPTLARNGFRLARRGIVFVGEHGVSAVRTATAQLRRMTRGTNAYTLLDAGRLTDMQQGTWQAVNASGPALDIAAFERNGVWYAHHYKVGGPWGRKLNNFRLFGDFSLSKLFRRLKPQSFTHRYVQKALPVAKTKLDNAIRLSSDTEWAPEFRQVLKSVFGTDSDEALQHVVGRLREMRKDLNSVSLANCSFRKADVDALAALDVYTYKLWKTAVNNKTVLRESIKRFIKIFPENLDDLYRTSKYDESRIADVLIHEISHGAPGTLDLYYGRRLNDVESDAASLIDLARNPAMADPAFVNPYITKKLKKFTHLDRFKSIRDSLPKLIQDHPALYNADSYELAVALISQIKSDPFGFGVNMATIENALRNIPMDQFIGSLAINVGKASN
ncbi:hypothetical protein [Pseudomonas sp. A34-9]|uniref:hypothetical protein n=1 Tax=Pseudomonas sp. A34-9 TaxID=3034675 RepID=UPI00240E0417|nr:hypothetical protein [Pseudomonas sp. A34-9]